LGGSRLPKALLQVQEPPSAWQITPRVLTEALAAAAMKQSAH
jgi:hypothetical protein